MLYQATVPSTKQATSLLTKISGETVLAGLRDNIWQTPVASYDTEKKIYKFPLQPLQQEQALAGITARLDALKTLHANWDGEGAKQPDPVAVDRAISLVNLMYLAAQEADAWKEPGTITADTYGRIFLTWWHGKGKTIREISIYVSSTAISGIRTWGQSATAIVDSIPMSLNKENLKDVWKWLTDHQAPMAR